MSEDIAARVTAIIAEKLETEPDKITRDTDLREAGVDSLKLVEVVMDIEEAFDVDIDLNAAEAFEQYQTAGDVIDAVKKTVEARA